MTEPRTAEAGPDPRRPAYDAVYAYLAATTDVPRDLVTRNAIVWRAVHAALDAAAGPAPMVAGRCPACRGESLMLTDGRVVCRRLDCPQPTAAHDAIEERAGANAYDRAINTPPSDKTAAAIRKQLAEGTMPRRRVRRTTPDNPPTSSDTADNSLIEQPDKPRHPDGEVYSWEELEAGGWGFCDGCRMWTNGSIDRPHQCVMAHIHGPAHDGPSITELAANDRNWDVEQGGE